MLSQQRLKAWVLSYGIANRVDSPLQLGEKVSAIHLAAAADSFGASEATRLRQGFGVVNRCIDYFGARD